MPVNVFGRIFNAKKMKSIIKRLDSGKKEIHTYPSYFKTDEVETSVSQIPSFKGVCGSEKRTFIEGIMMVERKITVPQKYLLEVEHDFPFLKMQFEMEGYSLFNSFIKDVPQVEIPGGTHRLFFLPQVKGTLTYCCNRDTLEINLSLDFINKLFRNDLNAMQQFGKGILNFEPSLLTEKPMPLTTEMRKCIFELKNCCYTGVYKRIFIENKVSELLLLQLNQLQSQNAQAANGINKQDRDKLQEVKYIIESNIHSPYTIIQLSNLVGINECKLKKQFKEAFGCTLFEYLTDVRLSKAKELLIENDYSVGEVSYMIGYRHSQHFATAFKKKYGLLPKELKKSFYY